MLRRIMLGIALSGLLPAGVAAQTTTSVLRSLCPGADLQVQVARMSHAYGHCSAPTDSTVTLASAGADRSVRIADIEAIWVREPATGDGAIVGGLIGFAAGAAMAVLLERGMCDTPDCGTVSTAIRGGIVVGLGGAALGAIVGSVSRTWSRRFP
jgi:hypothetical protein